MPDTEPSTKKATSLQEYKLRLHSLNTQLNMFSGLYQLTGEYAALCETLLREIQSAQNKLPPQA